MHTSPIAGTSARHPEAESTYTSVFESRTRPKEPHWSPDVHVKAINSLRLLCIDAAEQAGSAYPETAMALAPVAYRLYSRHMRHDPTDPEWADRDRLILSIGRAATLLYGALHLSGYDVTPGDAAGQLGSERCPGIDMTTGPPGQGIANGVGLAMAERIMAARYNDKGGTLFNHRTWVIADAGDMMQGVASEAASLAGHIGLGKLTVFFHRDQTSPGEPVSGEMSEDVGLRYRAYGWEVLRVADADDLDALDWSIDQARRESERPTLIVMSSHAGQSSRAQATPTADRSFPGSDAADTHQAQPAANQRFDNPTQGLEPWRAGNAQRQSIRQAWARELRAYCSRSLDGDELCRILARKVPQLPFPAPPFEPDQAISGHNASQLVIHDIARRAPELIGGSTDLAIEAGQVIEGSSHLSRDDWTGRNIRFGAREHAMGAITNGLASHGGLLPYCSTRLACSDYLKPAVRMAAMMGLTSIWVFTHDWTVVGEGGPKYEPVEQVAMLRAIPGLRVFRPADANEVAVAWSYAAKSPGPSAIVLSQRPLPVLGGSVDLGGRVVMDGSDLTIVATGSEVSLALDARDQLLRRNVIARVVSLPSWELFRERSRRERDLLMGDGPVLAVEAGASQGWHEFADDVIGVDHSDASASTSAVPSMVGLTSERVADRAAEMCVRRGRTGD